MLPLTSGKPQKPILHYVMQSRLLMRSKLFRRLLVAKMYQPPFGVDRGHKQFFPRRVTVYPERPQICTLQRDEGLIDRSPYMLRSTSFSVF